MTYRRCERCLVDRPPDHSYCYACGARLGLEILPANKRRFRQTGTTMGAPRVVTKADRRSESQPRTWRDTLAGLYALATLLGAAVLFASSRGWLAPGLWARVRLLLAG